jgi:hypothetical protein
MNALGQVFPTLWKLNNLRLTFTCQLLLSPNSIEKESLSNRKMG